MLRIKGQMEKFQLMLVLPKPFLKTGYGDFAFDIADLRMAHIMKMPYSLAGPLDIIDGDTVHIPGLEGVVQKDKGKACAGKDIQIVLVHFHCVYDQSDTVRLQKLLPFFFL